MSKLTKQLQQAKGEYESLRYRGDLASDLPAKPAQARSHRVRNLAVAAALALLATAGIVFMNRPAPSTELATTTHVPTDPVVGVDSVPVDPVPDVGSTDQEPVEEAWTLVPGESAAAQESRVSLVPEFQAMSLTLPSISGIDDYVEQEEPVTPE